MSNQKFFNPSSQAFEADLQKRVADTVYEVNIAPKVLYLSQITEKGEKKHIDAVVNRKLDQKYMKKAGIKEGTIPFDELPVSRNTTL
jgi:hypothetical protein